MKLTNIEQVTDFLKIIDTCKGDVYLKSQYGDTFNLRSKLSQYVAMGALLGNHGDELELWCDNKDDEAKMLAFFTEHKEVLE